MPKRDKRKIPPPSCPPPSLLFRGLAGLRFTEFGAKEASKQRRYMREAKDMSGWSREKGPISPRGGGPTAVFPSNAFSVVGRKRRSDPQAMHI